MRHTYSTSILAIMAIAAVPAAAQNTDDGYRSENEKSLIETVAKIEKKTDKINVFIGMHGDFTADWRGTEFQEGKFEMNQLRLEIKGQINKWLSYRYRQRLNKGDETSKFRDNVLGSIDWMGIGIKLKKFNAFLGKQSAAYGGIEFDKNPIEIYGFSDIGGNLSNFMVGVTLGYNFTPNQQLQVQMINSLRRSSQEMYGDWEKAKLPMLYTINWNGNFADIIKTRWSASFMNQTKGRHMWYFAVGNEFNITEKIGGYVDWMYSLEGVDRKGIMTSLVGGEDPKYNTPSAVYMSTLIHLNYRFHPSWNLFAKAMYDTSGLYSSHPDLPKGNYRTSWGYLGGIEYYPFKDRNLHFFVCYYGRSYKFTARARAYGNSNYNTNNLSVGFIWQMPIF